MEGVGYPFHFMPKAHGNNRERLQQLRKFGIARAYCNFTTTSACDMKLALEKRQVEDILYTSMCSNISRGSIDLWTCFWEGWPLMLESGRRMGF